MGAARASRAPGSRWTWATARSPSRGFAQRPQRPPTGDGSAARGEAARSPPASRCCAQRSRTRSGDLETARDERAGGGRSSNEESGSPWLGGRAHEPRLRALLARRLRRCARGPDRRHPDRTIRRERPSRTCARWACWRWPASDAGDVAEAERFVSLGVGPDPLREPRRVLDGFVDVPPRTAGSPSAHGDLARARSSLEKAVVLARRGVARPDLIYSLHALAPVRAAAGDPGARATRCARQRAASRHAHRRECSRIWSPMQNGGCAERRRTCRAPPMMISRAASSRCCGCSPPSYRCARSGACCSSRTTRSRPTLGGSPQARRGHARRGDRASPRAAPALTAKPERRSPAQASACARRSASARRPCRIVRPSVEPSSSSTACSGCGIRPSTFPSAFVTAATSPREPFGLST